MRVRGLRVIDELVYFSPHLLPRFTRFFSQEIRLTTTKLTLKIKNLAMAYVINTVRVRCLAQQPLRKL